MSATSSRRRARAIAPKRPHSQFAMASSTDNVASPGSGVLLRPVLAHLADDVSRDVGAAGCLTDCLGTRGLIQAVGLAPVRTQKGVQPVDADCVVHQLHGSIAFRREFEPLGPGALDQEQGHGGPPLEALLTAGKLPAHTQSSIVPRSRL